MERARSHSTMIKEPQPSPYWISSPSSHALFVDVPGFKREDLMVAIKKPRKVLVSGARPVSGNKTSHFMHEFDAPEDSEISQISVRFDDGVLTIILPRKVTEKAEEAIEQGSRKDKIDKEKDRKSKPGDLSHEEMTGSHTKDRISESDHEKSFYGPNKKQEWERNITTKDHDLPEKKQERDNLDHDIHKKEEEKGIEFELGPGQDLMFQKEEEERERDQITEGNELELDQSLLLEKGKEEERNQIIGGDLGIDQGLLQEKEEEEKERDQTVEESEQINDHLIQKEREEEERGRNLLIEAKEQGHAFHLEEGMRLVKIEGLGSFHAPSEDKTQKEGVLIERIANVDDLHEGRRKKKNKMDVERKSEGRKLRNDLSKEKGAKRNGNGKAEDPTQAESKQGKKTEEHTDNGSIVKTPMKEETKTTRDKKTVIVVALVALSIGFYWSHKILSNRVTESLK
ncbi:hypothetical protein Sjap_015816 [Stephania japonica]|uniref:SHSP domain-containing protein n=1 Tax=Stephania japonica TaxID=461633 RepID=A0AAP0IJW9_9MAGN